VGGAAEGLGAGGDPAGVVAVEVEGVGGAAADRAGPGVELAVGGVGPRVGGRAQARRLEEARGGVPRQRQVPGRGQQAVGLPSANCPRASY
jgi:hypothetical protein